ncbi:hypothetical protein Tco_0666979 [Tanacetum coccineum]
MQPSLWGSLKGPEETILMIFPFKDSSERRYSHAPEIANVKTLSGKDGPVNGLFRSKSLKLGARNSCSQKEIYTQIRLWVDNDLYQTPHVDYAVNRIVRSEFSNNSQLGIAPLWRVREL